MLLKTYQRCGIALLLCFVVTACVSNKPSRTPMTDEQEATLYFQMGVRYLEMNMLKTAKEKLEIAVEMDFKNAKIHNVLGALNERLKEYPIAGEYYQQALKLDNNNASISNNYGRFLCERGDVDKGMGLLKQALAMPLNDKKWFAYTNIGRCQLRLGNQELAENNFRQALQVYPGYAPALFEMQKISYRSEKYMSARAFLERYLAVAKHNSETLWYGIQTERLLGNKKLVEQYRNMLFTLFPLSKEAQQQKTVIR